MSGDNIYGRSHGCPALGLRLESATRNPDLQASIHANEMSKRNMTDHQYRAFLQSKEGKKRWKDHSTFYNNNGKVVKNECDRVPGGFINVEPLNPTNLNREWLNNAGIHSECYTYNIGKKPYNPMCDDSHSVDK
jgi:hypothetical protein